MVAELPLTVPKTFPHAFTDADRAKSALTPKILPLTRLYDAQNVLHKIITGAVRWHNGEEVVDVPAREIASCSVALCKLEERIRLNRGLANPSPVKAESKRRGPARPSATAPMVLPDVEPTAAQPQVAEPSA
jgi:hypothetical protein